MICYSSSVSCWAKGLDNNEAGCRGFPGGAVVKNPPATAGDTGDMVLIPEEEIPWRRKWPPTPVFLPGKFHGQRSMEGYSTWGHKRAGHDLTRN